METEQEEEETQIGIDGSRIINIEEYSDNLAKHSTHCDGSIVLKSESKHGLASIFTAECSTCSQTIRLETSKKVKGSRGYNR